MYNTVVGDENLLELRIHGVNNTPPVGLLYALEEEYGDSLVGVYRQRPNAGCVKAFSWGELARTSPFPRLPFAGWIQSVGSTAWIVTVPFGLANVAYWSRRLTLPGEEFDTVRRTTAVTRIFALGLTLLFAFTASSVSLDMAEKWITRRPGSLPKWLLDMEFGDRMVLLSLLPVVAILLLWGVAVWGRTKYDKGSRLPALVPAPSSATRDANAPKKVAKKDVWKFGSRDFWDNADLSKHNAYVHTSAGVASTLIWTGQFWFPLNPSVGRAMTIAAGAILVACVAMIMRMPLVTEAGEVGKGVKMGSTLLLGGTLGIVLVQSLAIVLVHSRPEDSRQLTGLSFLPAALVFGLLVIAVSALGWRRREGMAYVVAALLLLLGGAAVIVTQWCVLFTVLTALVVWFWLWQVYRPVNEGKDPSRAAEAWRGSAPGVLLVLSLFAAVLLSTVLVMVASAFMGSNRGERSEVPPIYLSFGSVLVPVIVGMAALLILVLWRVLRCAHQLEPELDATTGPSPEQIQDWAADFATSHPQPCWARRVHFNGWWTLAGRRSLTRRFASVAHRAEPMVAVLAVISGLGLGGGLFLALLLHVDLIPDGNGLLHCLQLIGVSAATLIGGAILGFGGTKGRPLGIVWDLMCFLPRAAHPFGPPCYAQRAVPEAVAFCQAWLNLPVDSAEGEAVEPRKLILSAHSLGGVLAVAVVLLLSDFYLGRIGLLTYGCQLRAYFGRIFPELLGPAVLGVTNSREAGLLRCQTFDDQPTSAPPDGGPPPSLRKVLTRNGSSLWINLWRPTDYLGFPVFSRERGNSVDVPADEVTAEVSALGRIDGLPAPRDVIAAQQKMTELLDRSPVALSTSEHFMPTTTVHVDTHGDYFRAPQYAVAVRLLGARLAEAAAPPPP